VQGDAATFLPSPAAGLKCLPNLFSGRGVTDWPIDLETLQQTSEFPLHHKDPFDRLLLAQALVHHFHIVTPDVAFLPYNAKVIW